MSDPGQSHGVVRATVRLQFHKGFTLNDAIPLVDYFSRLGISHVYASPLFFARPGSTHGYDIVDFGRINGELGGEKALAALSERLHQHGMGLILDIVPNHIAVGGSANPWWLDVLQWGRDSPYAGFFDIDWESSEPFLHNRVLTPFLRCDYGTALSQGEIGLHFDSVTGHFCAIHHEHRFPLFPPSYGTLLAQAEHPTLYQLGQSFAHLTGTPSGRQKAEQLCAQLASLSRSSTAANTALHDALAQFTSTSPSGIQKLHALLEQQHYRLASWRTAADIINWRRFFDINELAGLRIEDPEVFEATHGKLFELIEKGVVQGVRVDHIDGLANPRAYCRKLRRRIDRLTAPLGIRHFPIYVEKILLADESLPASWLVDGTTGYDFLEDVSLLLHERMGEAHLRALWASISGRSADFAHEVYQARRHVLRHSLAADLDRLVNDLTLLASRNPDTRDYTRRTLERTLVELIAHFPVYRTYAGAGGRDRQDDGVFGKALDAARPHLPSSHEPLLQQLSLWLGGIPPRKLPPGDERRQHQTILTRFQQLTSPVAAKAVEDTAGYRAGVLLSRYEVGAESDCFSTPIGGFHRRCIDRQNQFPHSLVTTATHDCKRGEDTRARLAVLSERASWFRDQLHTWRHLASALRSTGTIYAPTPGDEAILYQTLLGSWPLGLSVDDQPGVSDYLQRLLDWQQKALREAKLATGWQDSDEEYEKGCRTFLTQLLTAEDGQPLRQSLADAAASIAPAGALNSFTQCLLRMTTPGIPDLYQGTEWWDFSLVDPDNRRPVDFAARQQGLRELADWQSLISQWQDGRIKQYLVQRVLQSRITHQALSPVGEYLPLPVRGAFASNVIAFLRLADKDCALTIAPLHCADLLGDSPRPLVPASRWQSTEVEIPAFLQGMNYQSVLTGTGGRYERTLPLASVLADFPVNLLLSNLAEEMTDDR